MCNAHRATDLAAPDGEKEIINASAFEQRTMRIFTHTQLVSDNSVA